MNQRLVAAAAAISTLLGSNVLAETSFEYADVVASTPIYQVVQVSTPQEQCWEEEMAVDRYSHRNQSNTPVLVSTIIGGAIGNAVGHNKSNQRVGAVLGAVLGHSIGRDIIRQRSRSDYVEYETVQRCNTVYEQHEEERLVGYQVTYLYNGEEYSIRTDSDPGDQIRIRVSVQPVL
ncbi:MAG: glycine zipper 2TM domain-containing protein [Pseudomonadales bacterium]|nr:glycine zipper 2TM domain-containing protein [Pseudomonadales bacterium]